MTHNNQEERSVEELDEIQRLIVEKDPDDNDKFLRQLWDLVAQAKETFHHQLQKAQKEILEILQSRLYEFSLEEQDGQTISRPLSMYEIETTINNIIKE